MVGGWGQASTFSFTKKAAKLIRTPTNQQEVPMVDSGRGVGKKQRAPCMLRTTVNLKHVVNHNTHHNCTFPTHR